MKLLLSLSGGPDSTSLLLALCQIRSQYASISIEAAHINHGLRGQESAQDELFCQSICDRLQVPVQVFKDMPSTRYKNDDARSEKFSESALRDTRYKFLRDLCQFQDFDFALTAHTKDDQAETILFRLTRGTSLSGMCGIRSVSALSEKTTLLRPLLNLSRQDVMSFLSAENVVAREDQSNQELTYSRNFIRHKILTELNERFSGASERISRFAVSASLDNDYIEEQVAAHFANLNLVDDVWICSSVSQLHESLQNRLLALALRCRGIEINDERIRNLKSMLNQCQASRITLNKNWHVVKEVHHIRWLPVDADDTSSFNTPVDFEVKLKICGVTPLLTIGKAFLSELLDEEELDEELIFPSTDSLTAVIDLSRSNGLREPLIMRRRRAGDFIQPFGRQEIVGLKKFLHTRKAASRVAHLREVLDPRFSVTHCIVIASGQEILWIPGIGLSEKLRVNLKPTHRLSILSLSDDCTLA